MERSGNSQPDENAGSFWTQQAHVSGTVKDQLHHQSTVSCHQAPCKSPPPPPHQQEAPELQALAIVYKMMLVQQDHFRIMASINGTTAAWDAIYNDRFAEEDARLKAKCQRLLGIKHNTTGSNSSPESALHFIEQHIGDLLQAERERRPHPVEQESTVTHDRRSRSAEGEHPQPQLINKADDAVDAEIPDQLLSEQSPVDTSSITLGNIDDVACTAGSSQYRSSTQGAHSNSLCSGISRSHTMARSDNSISTGSLNHATSFHIPAARRGCLSCSVNTQAWEPVKTTSSHRFRLRPKTRWKSITPATPRPSLNNILYVALSLSPASSQASTININTSEAEHQHTSENIITSPLIQQQLGFSTIINTINIFMFKSPRSSTVLHHFDLR